MVESTRLGGLDTRSVFGGVLAEESFMDVGDHTTTSNGGLDEDVELFVTSDSKKEMTRCDSSHLEVLGCISSQFEHFCSEIFQNGSCVNCSSCANSVLCAHSSLQESVDSSNGELIYI